MDMDMENLTPEEREIMVLNKRLEERRKQALQSINDDLAETSPQAQRAGEDVQEYADTETHDALDMEEFGANATVGVVHEETQEGEGEGERERSATTRPPASRQRREGERERERAPGSARTQRSSRGRESRQETRGEGEANVDRTYRLQRPPPDIQKRLEELASRLGEMGHDEAAGQAAAHLGVTANAAYLKEQNKALKQELAAMAEELASARDEAGHAQRKANAAESRAQELERSLRKAGTRHEAMRKQVSDAQDRTGRAEAALETARREGEAARRQAQGQKSAVSHRDKQLTRALDSAARYKTLLAASEERLKEVEALSRKSSSDTTARVGAVERERSELVAVVRKQAELINVLRQQKLHLEAASRLAISEEEFARVLEMGPTE
ncbi:hypothetical protein KIPB_002472 [Kipferlia bialata]|uniref:Uncharacterized protein n=1 Tax=Kipferlia bialata TaxID=797122 RepID=A0A9K3GG59_9EUKA|nr:hypothetical protein KIPB_002472 [Kipferlia bialata]|eukprot:g2472.t1